MIFLVFCESENGHFVIFILNKRCHLADICALIKVSQDLYQVALEISFVYATRGKTIVYSHCMPILSEMAPPTKKEMFYLTTHSTHFIYDYMASGIW